MRVIVQEKALRISEGHYYHYFIQRLPTIDAEPVRHGRWEWKNGRPFCSVCKNQNEPKHYFEDGTVEEYNYCPNCGAKMDKGE